MTKFNPATGTAVNNSADTLLYRLQCATNDPMDQLTRSYLEAAIERIEHLENQLV